MQGEAELLAIKKLTEIKPVSLQKIMYSGHRSASPHNGSGLDLFDPEQETTVYCGESAYAIGGWIGQRPKSPLATIDLFCITRVN